MQYLARLASAGSEINSVATALTIISPCYIEERNQFINLYVDGCITDPHLAISYYLLSNK